MLSNGIVTPLGPTAASASNTVFIYADPTHAQVFRNGGTIFSYAPPNVYLTPTAGATPTVYQPSPPVLRPIEMLGGRRTADRECCMGGYLPHAQHGVLGVDPARRMRFSADLDVTAAAFACREHHSTAPIISGKHFSGLTSFGAHGGGRYWSGDVADIIVNCQLQRFVGLP